MERLLYKIDLRRDMSQSFSDFMYNARFEKMHIRYGIFFYLLRKGIPETPEDFQFIWQTIFRTLVYVYYDYENVCRFIQILFASKIAIEMDYDWLEAEEYGIKSIF